VALGPEALFYARELEDKYIIFASPNAVNNSRSKESTLLTDHKDR
jgi:hypothetical protein